MRTLMAFLAAIAGLAAAPASAQSEKDMQLQRCVWACLSRSTGNQDPAYHACVKERCVASERPPATRPEARARNSTRPDRDTVAFVQRSLARLGFDPGPADGVFGRRTAAAVQAFRASRGLQEVGRIDDTLVAALRSARQNANAAAGPSSPRDFLRGIYELPDPDAAILEPSRRGQYFSPRLIELIRNAESGYLRRHGTRELDFNPVVPGQDTVLKSREIGEPEVRGERAIVSLRLTRPDDWPGEKNHELVYELVASPSGSWLIDEIEVDGRPFSTTLKEYGSW